MTTDLIPKVFFDIENVRENIEKEFNLNLIQGIAETFEVTCEDTAKHALSMALQSRKLEQSLEKSRVELVKPHIDYQRSINKLVRDFKNKLNSMESLLQKKIETWMQDNADNPFLHCDDLKVEDGSLYKQKIWDFEILDDTQLPREYLCIDLVAIEKAVRAGVRKIPGIKIMQKEKIMMRVKN